MGMLSYFRKIRRSLIDTGSTRRTASPFGRYMLYAIGEIALVVIGILIAVQINNWNEYRKDRNQEVEILMEIKNTLELNSELMIEHVSLIEGLNETSDKVNSIIENANEYTDSYGEDFYFSFYSGTNIYLSNDGYEGLKNSGFEIIRNSVLRKAIVHLFGVQYLKTTEFVDYMKDHFKIYESFVIQHFITEQKKLVPIDFSTLRNNSHFIAIIKRMKERRNRVHDTLKKNLEENEIVLQLINSELKK